MLRIKRTFFIQKSRERKDFSGGKKYVEAFINNNNNKQKETRMGVLENCFKWHRIHENPPFLHLKDKRLWFLVDMDGTIKRTQTCSLKK